MSSSISSSEPAPEWGRWLAAFLGVFALGAVLVFGFVHTSAKAARQMEREIAERIRVGGKAGLGF
jgi:hypothetical protein